MSHFLVVVLAIAGAAIGAGYWLTWQLLRQNGRILLRLEDIEERLHAFGEAEELADGTSAKVAKANRFGNRSLTRSKLKRDGLKAGTLAPEFRLPRLDGRGELSLEDFRGRRLVLVFSHPHCGPCNALAPELEKFHGNHHEIALLMLSRDEPKENRAKVKELGLTFPVVLQQRWEISRRYAMFATPIAYLIDERGIIAQDVAVGVEQIQALLSKAANGSNQSAKANSILNSTEKM